MISVLIGIFIIAFLVMFIFKIVKICKDNTPAQQIRNTDVLMRNFCFQTNKTKEEIIAALNCHSIYDVFDYNYNPQTDIIHFFNQLMPGYNTRYKIYFFECDQFTCLKISQQNHFYSKNNFLYRQNEFWIKKLDAKPIPYFPS